MTLSLPAQDSTQQHPHVSHMQQQWQGPAHDRDGRSTCVQACTRTHTHTHARTLCHLATSLRCAVPTATGEDTVALTRSPAASLSEQQWERASAWGSCLQPNTIPV